VVQIEEILNEVKFSHYVETGECRTDIDLPDFIRCNAGNFFSLALSSCCDVYDVTFDSSNDRSKVFSLQCCCSFNIPV